MNTRSLTIAVSLASLLLLIVVAGAQSHRASALRTAKQTILTSQTAPIAESDTVNTTHDADATAAPGTLELLQLRNQIGQLMQRRRELETERAENERLRALVSARNSSANASLPPGYIRKQQARWMGQNSPENTLESFLWALQHRDFTNLISLLTPGTAAELTQLFAESGTTFFDKANVIPGMRIADQKQLPDGSIAAKIEVAPGQDMGKNFIFRMIDGQWKIDFKD